jgi:hypothetical protein
MIIKQNQIVAYDGSTQANAKQIQFTDLIGQPTWYQFGVTQFKTAMRADINVNDYIKMPAGQVTTTAQSASQYRQGSVFSGTFWVSSVRHVGNFRQQDSNSWVTIITTAALPTSGVAP